MVLSCNMNSLMFLAANVDNVNEMFAGYELIYCGIKAGLLLSKKEH